MDNKTVCIQITVQEIVEGKSYKIILRVYEKKFSESFTLDFLFHISQLNYEESEMQGAYLREIFKIKKEGEREQIPWEEFCFMYNTAVRCTIDFYHGLKEQRERGSILDPSRKNVKKIGRFPEGILDAKLYLSRVPLRNVPRSFKPEKMEQQTVGDAQNHR
ncbi:hypothetical protein A2442_02030 [Candidatus Campbellbacteria bacterium RIFOXYC2_FULL_35_25]|uniref:Uncharacterized protein n=1 Tax=Candidatus Campbellbacteria bacterium RIFOXYC2_FULL_35_25 TaxID=1797582 RepID=A0A1F5EIW8_9BACT|nr:MAG: hypothetical protein A2442_02030 [Candidatus Campbellbacteria bacterium RIFOXYC2_FULL_35_25]